MKPLFKQSRLNFLSVIAFAVYFTTLAACHKDPKPTIVGKWETVQEFGLAWEHEFKTDGQTCRRAPEVFGTTAFCWEYYVDGSTVTINANTVEIWQYEFVCDDVADVLVTLPDGEKKRFILKRIN